MKEAQKSQYSIRTAQKSVNQAQNEHKSKLAAHPTLNLC